jgi:hypothetical protein
MKYVNYDDINDLTASALGAAAMECGLDHATTTRLAAAFSRFWVPILAELAHEPGEAGPVAQGAARVEDGPPAGMRVAFRPVEAESACERGRVCCLFARLDPESGRQEETVGAIPAAASDRILARVWEALVAEDGPSH